MEVEIPDVVGYDEPHFDEDSCLNYPEDPREMDEIEVCGNDPTYVTVHEGNQRLPLCSECGDPPDNIRDN